MVKWEGLRNVTTNDKVKKFCKVAIDILSKPPGTGQLESTFNGLKFIHTQFRNRLGKEKLAMLLYIWWNGKKLRLIKQNAMT